MMEQKSGNIYLQPFRSTTKENPSHVDSPRSIPFDISRPTSSQGTHPPSLISPASPSSSSSPSPRYYPSLYHIAPRSNNHQLEQHHQQQQREQHLQKDRHLLHNTPTFRIDPARDNEPAHQSTPTSTSTTANMRYASSLVSITNHHQAKRFFLSSAVAVHYDSRGEMGYPRSSMTWPGLEPNVDFLGHDLMSHAGSDVSMTPPSTSRSSTSSPPRGMMTPEQRELKRQRDQARRESKTSVRARRAMSSTSYGSTSPQMSMSEFSTASPMPIYTTSPSQISLLAEPVTTVPGSSYIPSYSTSPLPEPSAMFTSPFPTL